MPPEQPQVQHATFADREKEVELVRQRLGRCLQRDGRSILNVTGQGGIGKSRFLRELRSLVDDSSSEWLLASLEFDESRHTNPTDALLRLRRQWIRTRRLEPFDLVLAVLMARSTAQDHREVYRRLAADTDSRILKRAVDLLAEAADSAIPLPFPVAKSVKDLIRLLHDEASLDWLEQKHDLEMCDRLDVRELSSKAREWLGFALRLDDRPSLLLIDDADVHVAADSDSRLWLQDLVRKLDTTVVVITSSEDLDWSSDDGYWETAIEHVPLEVLQTTSAELLLASSGVDDHSYREQLAGIPQNRLPLFLVLAAEAFRRGSRERFSLQQVERQALQHVDLPTAESLRTLSVAAAFDEELYRSVASSRAGARTFDHFVEFSFVEEHTDGMRIHPVLAEALVQTLVRKRAVREAHEELFNFWSTRCQGIGHAENLAWQWTRELTLHGLGAGKLDSSQALDLIADVGRVGGIPAQLSMAQDLKTVSHRLSLVKAQERRADEVGRLARLVELEAHAASGSTAAVSVEELPAKGSTPKDEVEARHWIAVGDIQRISGDRPEAPLGLYRLVWQGWTGETSRRAAHWVADLEMATGNFDAALKIARKLISETPTSDAVALARLERLMHLAMRFSFDPEAARLHLDAAMRLCPDGVDPRLAADLGVNQLELHAFSGQPSSATLEETVDRQLAIGAMHEVGKAMTAAALAEVVQGDLAAASLQAKNAVETLESCGYRSGLARALIVSAVIAGRQGDAEEAVRLASEGVRILEKSGVYPTLVIFASRLVDRIGRPDPTLRRSAERAKAKVCLPPGAPGLDAGISELLERSLGDNLSSKVIEASTSNAAMKGNYNSNVRIGDELVRKKKAGPKMDLAIWDEGLVLSAVSRAGLSVPKLLAIGYDPDVAIHEWIDGQVLDHRHPKHSAVDEPMAQELGRFIGSLHAVAKETLPDRPADWADDEDSIGFAQLILESVETVHAENAKKFSPLWQRLSFPVDPFESVDLNGLDPRPFQLLHCDVHRQNVIVRPDSSLVVLDWELALWGDPVYDLAVHLHKMKYTRRDEARATRAWRDASLESTTSSHWQRDLRAYRWLENIKTAIVDSVRVSTAWKANPKQGELLTVLQRKLEPAYDQWGLGPVPDVRTLQEILLSTAVEE